MKKGSKQRKCLLKEITRIEGEVCSTCPVMKDTLPVTENCIGCNTYKDLNQLGILLIEDTIKDRKRRGIIVQEE